MNRLALCILSAIFFLTFATITHAEQTAVGKKGSSQQWSEKVCKPIEQYFALIEAAASSLIKAEREKKYAAAKQSLTAALEPLGKAALIEELVKYQRITESIVQANPDSPTFPQLMDKRTNMRTSILNHCLNVSPGL